MNHFGTLSFCYRYCISFPRHCPTLFTVSLWKPCSTYRRMEDRGEET